MKNRKKTVQMKHRKTHTEKPPVCPYCGRRSVLRPAEYVYGDHTITAGSLLYVCSGYPECRAYVGVHEGTRRPKGGLADSELRNKRIRAHRALDAVVRSGCMSKDGVYVWLSGRMGLPYEETHIGYFSDYFCEQTIEECRRVLDNWRTARGKKAA